MRRVHAVAAGVAVLALALAGCGVQPTGVNVASGNPISATQNSPSSSPTATGPTFPVRLFLTSRGTLVPVTRQVGGKPSSAQVIYWLQHPDSRNPSTHIIVPGQSYGGFDDCLNYAPMAAGQTAVYPATSAPTIAKTP